MTYHPLHSSAQGHLSWTRIYLKTSWFPVRAPKLLQMKSWTPSFLTLTPSFAVWSLELFFSRICIYKYAQVLPLKKNKDKTFFPIFSQKLHFHPVKPSWCPKFSFPLNVGILWGSVFRPSTFFLTLFLGNPIYSHDFRYHWAPSPFLKFRCSFHLPIGTTQCIQIQTHYPMLCPHSPILKRTKQWTSQTHSLSFHVDWSGYHFRSHPGIH